MINVYLCPESEKWHTPQNNPIYKTAGRHIWLTCRLYKSQSAWKRVHQPRITTLVFSFQNQHAQMSTSRNNPAGITVHGEMNLLITCDLKRDKACERMNIHQYIWLQRRPVLLVSKTFARVHVKECTFSCTFTRGVGCTVSTPRSVHVHSGHWPSHSVGLDLCSTFWHGSPCPRVAHPIFPSGLSFDYLRWCSVARILVHHMRCRKFSPIIFHPIKWAVIITARIQHAPLPDNYIFQYSTYWLMSGCNLTPTVSVPREKRGLIVRG